MSAKPTVRDRPAAHGYRHRVVLLALAVVVGVVSGRLRVPLGLHAPRLQFRFVGLLFAGAVLNLVANALTGAPAVGALAASLVLLLGFVATNLRITGVAVVGVGLLTNLVALLANGGMPVRPGALVAAGVVEEADLDTVSFRGPRHLESGDDLLPVLGDALPLPVGGEVLSFGDLIVVLGAADAVRDLTRRRRKPWTAEQRAAYTAELAGTGTASAWAEPGPVPPSTRVDEDDSFVRRLDARLPALEAGLSAFAPRDVAADGAARRRPRPLVATGPR